MHLTSRIFVAGHTGMAGQAVLRTLLGRGYCNLILRSHDELNLMNQMDVNAFFKQECPEFVILLAAKVGGILDNIERPAEFIYDNLMIQCNVIHASYMAGVKKLLFVGSSCIYPRECPQPMQEEMLLTGLLEPTNEAYAIAKIAGIKMCEYYSRQYGVEFICMMPPNLYGKGDNFDNKRSHVISALMKRMHKAKLDSTPSVVVWGSGKARREFLYVDDMADAAIFLLNAHPTSEFINVGTGKDICIGELAEIIKAVVGYGGELVFDTSKPDGMPQKLMDSSKILELGWHHNVELELGLHQTYEWFISNYGANTK